MNDVFLIVVVNGRVWLGVIYTKNLLIIYKFEIQVQTWESKSLKNEESRPEKTAPSRSC